MTAVSPIVVNGRPVPYGTWPGTEDTRRELHDFIEIGLVPERDDLVYALLTNDLFGVYRCADLFHVSRVQDMVRWLYNHVPADCKGSPSKVALWGQHRAAVYAQEAKREAARGRGDAG